METILKGDQMNLKEYFLQDAKPFVSKREIDWKKVKLSFIWTGAAMLLLVVIYPTGKVVIDKFTDKLDVNSPSGQGSYQGSPSNDAVRSFGGSNLSQVHGSLDYLYSSNTTNGGSGTNQSSSMILNRDESSKSKLNAGVHVEITLSQSVSVSNQSIPVIGLVSKDVFTDTELAISKGAKILGVASFDGESETASIAWNAIQFEGGRQLSISALSTGDDGELAVRGKVFSHGAKNAIGQTLTNFIGSYAAGSMNRGALGANEGGHKNGLKNAVADTAKNQAVNMGEKLSKEKKWIELESGTRIVAVINQPFNFKDAEL